MAPKTTIRSTKRKSLFTEYRCGICSKRFSNKSGLKIHTLTHSTDRPFSCQQCPHTSKTKKYLSKHVKKVHGPRTEECSVCRKKFHYKCILKRHMLIHTGEKPYKCNVCKKSFNTRYSLKTHQLIHSDSKPYKYSFCDYSCRDSSTLRKHEARHMGIERRFECKVCHKCYKTKRVLKLHISEVHLGVKLNNTPCPDCGKEFKSLERRNTHIIVHDRVYSCTCDICGLIISNKYMMDTHLTTHSDLKPFLCSFGNCEKRFKDKGTLKKHTIIHYPDQHHPCPTCGKLFARISRLKKHSLQHKEKTKCVFCDHCGKGFYNKNYLASHITRKHVLRERFVCDLCDLITYNKPSIVMHLKYGHVNERDRKCRICKKVFKEHKYLKQHYWVTHCIKYKVMQRQTKKPIQIKQEVVDYKQVEILHEVKVERVDDDEKSIQYTKPDVCENVSAAVISEDVSGGVPRERVNLEQIDQLLVEHVIKPGAVEEVQKDVQIDEKCRQEAQKQIKQLLTRARREKEARELERTRRMYNRRIREASRVKLDVTRIKYVKMNGEDNERVTKDEGSLNEAEGNDLNDAERSAVIDDVDGAVVDEIDEDDTDKKRDENMKNNKFKLNSHQCYVCLKLYGTREELLEHCQEHFDVCNSTILKKCPLCDYVTKLNISRHIRNVHNIKNRICTRINENKNEKDGTGYYYSIEDRRNIIEIIPSVKELNKRACIRLDQRRKDNERRGIQKTRLVKKNGEWIVEKQDINISDYILPEIGNVMNVASNDYVSRLKVLGLIAKNAGRSIMYPCDKCEKICQTLSALKLHYRKHEDNPKPFKPKVWKHKNGLSREPVTNEPVPSENRYQKPKPIVSKHRCDPKLEEFYANNIKGGDIEFWHFLKIFNKMSKENVNDFKDLEKRTDFGIHLQGKAIKETSARPKQTHRAFTRTIMLTRKDYNQRKGVIAKMRQNIRRYHEGKKI
ncbi:uncharacterized protein LOC116778323 isoform X2 [Danaus plexippus]|uniref:uncharacterized protein LOC116778323 isoform X2 n=1 Tax=Danaus plexippus TaxID=13037 RepID=UPI002AAF9042|nr:uncharacterized protein LOC116778323 isoform X2 [Danaus plexippus]